MAVHGFVYVARALHRHTRTIEAHCARFDAASEGA